MVRGLTPIRALIVDDEPWARRRISHLLESEPEIIVAAECAGGVEAVQAIDRLKPDLVFLDVQMPDLDGFEVMEHVAKPKLPAVIFVTAYDAHALRAFEVHALDYLLKPFDRKRFHDAVNRAVKLIQAGSDRDQMDRIAKLLESQRPKSNGLQRLLIRGVDKLYFVSVGEIDWIEAAGNYVQVHAHSKSHLLRQTMKSLEQRLDPSSFARIHRSAIVNLDRIAELRPLCGGDYAVILNDGTRLSLSKSYRDQVIKTLE